jgi:hypothetical protein
LDPTGALEFIPLSHQHLLTFVIGSEHALELAGPGFGDSLADPLGHLLGRRPGQREGREVKLLPVTEIGPDFQRAHLAIADDKQPRLLEPFAQTLQEREV